MEKHDKILIAVDDSEASTRAVAYMSQMVGRHPNIQVRLFHVLPAIPPELLEFGGSEDPETEHRLSMELKKVQAQWIEKAKQEAQSSLDKARTMLCEGGFSAHAISTTLSPTIHKPDVVREVLEAARDWGCGTIVVGRHAHSRVHELSPRHVGEELARKANGFAIWVVA